MLIQPLQFVLLTAGAETMGEAADGAGAVALVTLPAGKGKECYTD